MLIELKHIEPYKGWIPHYLKLARQFQREYQGSLWENNPNRKYMEQKCWQDITQGYLFFVVADGERCGIVNAPSITNNLGEVIGRYLDSRYILPTHRHQGIGDQVMNELEQLYGVKQVKITKRYLMKRWQYWLERGYDKWLWAHDVDQYHGLEKFNQDWIDNHCYVCLPGALGYDVAMVLNESMINNNLV